MRELLLYSWDEKTQTAELVYAGGVTETRHQPLVVKAPDVFEYFEELRWYLETQA